MIRTLSAVFFLGAICATSGLAQTTTSPPSSSTAPAAVATNHDNNTTAAPVAGANSFTMAQAQRRIEDKGYSQVTELTKDDKSIWRGHAMKDGKAMNVALDFQGNITAN